MNSAEIKKAAKECGADLVGIAPVERFDSLPEKSDPRTLAPGARSVIVVGHRILRGALRGVEEGTCFYSNYKCFGWEYAENQFLAKTVYDLCCCIERAGFEAVPVLSKKFSGNRFEPDYHAYAHAAGLGSTGKGGFFLTPEYGHRQRFGFIFTTLPLDGDEAADFDFCKDCNACMEACPLGAYDPSGSLNLSLCAQCRNGAYSSPAESDVVDRYAASCGRACMVALEKKVGNRFANQFRKRSVWRLGLDGEALAIDQFVGGKCPDKFEGK